MCDSVVSVIVLNINGGMFSVFFFILNFVLFWSFRDRISQCSPGWPGTM